MKHWATWVLSAVLSGTSLVYAAKDLDDLGALGQAEFGLLSKDLGAALSYKSVSSGMALGVAGFDLGLSVTGTDLQHPEVWQSATSSADAPDTLWIPRLQVTKGLPAGFDIGAFVSSVPETNIQLLGGELSYSIVDQGITMPSLSVRGTFSRLAGVDQLDLDTSGIEFSVAKDIAIVTPYAGVGRIWTDSEPAAATGLSSESLEQNRYFLGANLSLLLFSLSLEIDETDDTTSYNSRLGVRF